MSTVVYRNGIMAGETLTTRGNERMSGIQKIGRTENYLFGFAGRLAYMRPTYQWIALLDAEGVAPQDFYKYREQLDVSDGGDAMIVTKKGQIWNIDLEGYAHTINRPFNAIGSGCEFALGALEYGATAIDAVKAAATLDMHSGGDVQNWTFDDPIHCPNERED